MNDNTFNLVIGVLALISTVASLLRYFQARLPIKQIESFDSILRSSKILFIKAGKNGFMTESLHAEINMRFERLDVSSLEARARAYESSRGLGLLIEAAEDLRLFIVVRHTLARSSRLSDSYSGRIEFWIRGRMAHILLLLSAYRPK
ncbi:hypothetical protein BD779DRAFT_1667845 [Infundibulicybe gibba]|nr:hypothetical protein BD779DRAFT_1667845 [Infundibulicybe gibba]